MSQKRGKVLLEHHVDLAILWRDVEGLSYPECVSRLVDLFGEELQVTPEALTKRINRRLESLGNAGVDIKKTIANPNDLSDAELVEWMRYLMYSEIYIAKSKNDSAAIRQSIKTTLDVLKFKKDLGSGASDEDEEMKKMTTLLKQIQGDRVVN